MSGMDLYQKKYSVLKRKCEELHQTNERLVNRIHHVKRILKRYKCERRMLVEELDKHGDDFREAEIPPMYEILSGTITKLFIKSNRAVSTTDDIVLCWVAGGCESQDIGESSELPNTSDLLSDQDKATIASSSDMLLVGGNTTPSFMATSTSSRSVPLGR